MAVAPECGYESGNRRKDNITGRSSRRSAPTGPFSAAPPDLSEVDVDLKFNLLSARAYCKVPRKVGRQPVHEAGKREKRRSSFVLQNEANCRLRPVRATAGVEFIDENGGGPGGASAKAHGEAEQITIRHA